MVKPKEDFGTLLAAGLLGAGIGYAAAALLENERRRTEFTQELSTVFERWRLHLYTAVLGRGSGQRFFWDLTLKLPSGQIGQTRVALPSGTEPFSADAKQFIYNSLQIHP